MNLLTDDELWSLPTGTVFTFDIECYPNYFLVAFRELKSKKIVYFESTPDGPLDVAKLRRFIWRICMVGFNSENYDIPMLSYALAGASTSQLKSASDAIIYGALRPWDFENQYRCSLPNINHIDLKEVAPLQASLKTYGGRLHCTTMRELPYEDKRILSRDEATNVLEYCCNDLEQTELLLIELAPHIELRESLTREYGKDFRSLSDAQVAEQIIKVELYRASGVTPKAPENPATVCRFNVPPYMGFQLPQLRSALETIAAAEFHIGANGSAVMPPEIAKLSFAVGKMIYKLGIGGVHSTEKEAAHYADEETLLLDVDVASYYPRIIINQKLFPSHLGAIFLTVYNALVNKRLAAKKAGNKKISEGLKIAINGIFGKLGNIWSAVYSPDLLLQVTLSGQLSLLMLIEMITLAEIDVVSGNTDGIVIKCKKIDYLKLKAIVKYWEEVTGFETEETRYKAIFSRDVNNYIAVKEDGTCKTKGAYCERGSAQNSILSKNPESLICSDAVQALLTQGIPLSRTIRECRDVRRFVTVRKVNGGAQKDGRYLGKTVRWYHAVKVIGAIKYKLNGNNVPNTQGAQPLMTLPEMLPQDVDYDYYIKRAHEMLFDVGYYQRPKTASLF